jgi:hypothetical protein
MPYKDGKVNMKGYGAKERLAAKMTKKKVKPIGSRVQSPDQQEKTMTMGKQPVAVYPAMKGKKR